VFGDHCPVSQGELFYGDDFGLVCYDAETANARGADGNLHIVIGLLSIKVILKN
jgi:hypothetical protein